MKINERHPINLKKPLIEAVDNHCGEVMILLIRLGTNPNTRDGKDDTFILHNSLRDKYPGAIRTTRLLMSFIQDKADTVRDEEPSNTVASSDSKRYWLKINRKRKNYRIADMVEMGVPHLPRFIFALIEQAYAQWMIVLKIMKTLANEETKYHRMFYMLGGPPNGHGKIMTAR